MITLGINAAFHDSSAAIVVDGLVVAASEEERYTRIKHAKRALPFSAWELPFHAIDHCLEAAGIKLHDVDHVAYSFDPQAFVAHRDDGLSPAGPFVLPDAESRPTREDRGVRALRAWDNRWDPLFLAYMQSVPRHLADGAPHHLRRRLAKPAGQAQPRWRFHHVDHHLCHQASAFLAAPFDRCAVLTLDGRGEEATTTYGVYRGHEQGRAGSYRPLGEVRMPHSLGLLYERVTMHLGFLGSSDEYKVMALAALGRPKLAGALEQHVHVGSDGRYRIEAIDMARVLGPARALDEPLSQHHFDIAASLQVVLEDTVGKLARWLRETSGESKLAMAGGVALNCVMNAKLRDSGLFDAVWVQPAAGDAGTALGAALWIDARERPHESVAPVAEPAPNEPVAVPLAERRWTMEHAYLGPSWSEAQIEELLRWAKLDYRRPDDLAEATAELLARNAVVGWYQGRMEWGPRALGARSILASPIDPAMQQRLNDLKDREDFRPVAPAILEERFAQWFEPAEANGGTAPFMLFVYRTKAGCAERIPSACHSDGTARVQTVSAQTNPAFHALLAAFERRTGVPVLVNTSFNVRGQPVVCRPQDALEAFFTTPLDALAIGPFLIEK
ncbi:MAG TPA: carbamoyltransferase C-terminal domain-containing protein [Methylibium sp.]|uniref:carbamoyltransferase family protein n=1 Tax=Methylibium sp. TaxID=2067992 RepID=UPI002DB7B028|nr:carbamoyltransferase C-terminal domain-containing protein [Methylibium sp.]HEU4459116.1 carbamoyltransferase C-terminal domain-containing protein [Methylibium sp.]